MWKQVHLSKHWCSYTGQRQSTLTDTQSYLHAPNQKMIDSLRVLVNCHNQYYVRFINRERVKTFNRIQIIPPNWKIVTSNLLSWPHSFSKGCLILSQFFFKERFLVTGQYTRYEELWGMSLILIVHTSAADMALPWEFLVSNFKVNLAETLGFCSDFIRTITMSSVEWRTSVPDRLTIVVNIVESLWVIFREKCLNLSGCA